MTETFDTNAENNDKSVLLSEEIDFLTELASAHRWPPDVYADLMDRDNVLEQAMGGAPAADPTDDAEEGQVPG